MTKLEQLIKELCPDGVEYRIRSSFASGETEEKRAFVSLDADNLFHWHSSIRGAIRYRRGGITRRCRDQLQGQAQAGIFAEATLSDLETV